MLKSFLKISTVILLVSFCYVSVNYIGQTNAFFSDQAIITNTLTAGVLDMTLRSGQSNFVPGADDMEPGDQVNRDIYVGKTAISLPLKHKVSFQYTGGNQDFCNQLDLKIWYDHYHGPVSGGYANRDMRLTYNGKLSNLANHTHIDFTIPHPDDQFDTDSTDGTEQWFYYSIILPSGTDIAYQDQTCNFDFVFEAWQTNFPDSTQGFTDTEQISNSITSGHWEAPTQKENMADHLVISEVQAYGDSDDDDWIELYNPTDNAIDLSAGHYRIVKAAASANWYIVMRIGDGTDGSYPGGTTIPARGFYLIVRDDASQTLQDKADAIGISDKFTWTGSGYTLYLGTDAISSDGDPDIVDKVGFGSATYYEGANPAPEISNGKSIERKSGPIHEENKGNGYDTDDNSNDFILRNTPEPQNSSSSPEVDCPEVVLNEFLPNADQFPEYIELYNKGDEPQDVNGWKIKLSNDVEIIISSDILYGNATSTIIDARGSGTEWLAIDLSKIGIGLNILDDTNDTIYLYNENGDKKDEISYPLLESDSNPKPTPGEENETGENVSPPDKSFARFPDGIGDWIDPYPTPGGPNKLEEEPEIIDDQQDTTPLPQDSPEEPQITEDNPDETADEEAEAIKEDEKSGEGTTEGETGKEDSDTENEGDPTAETGEELATEESDDEILPTEEPTDQAEEETPADEEPTADETTVEEEPSIMPEETTIVDGDVSVESDGDDGGGDSDDTGDDGNGNGEAGEAGTE